MTETTFKVQLNELQIVRIICPCGGIVEVPMAKLYSINSGTQCPVCHNNFVGQQAGSTIFSDLHHVLDRLAQYSFKLEFPIRIGPSKPDTT
jgi:hypothetical protein